jgi:tetratricopeptide (TPR) repeat protein
MKGPLLKQPAAFQASSGGGRMLLSGSVPGAASRHPSQEMPSCCNCIAKATCLPMQNGLLEIMFRRCLFFFAGLLPLFAIAAAAKDFSLDDARKLWLSGKYTEVISLAREAIDSREWDENWRIYLGKALWTTGQYEEASKVMTAAVRNQPYSIRTRMAAWPIFRSNGELAKASKALDEINELGGYRRGNYRDPQNFVALGEAAVLLGADPKVVLDNFLEPARKADPKMKEVYLAIGRLALTKHDYALASKNLQAGLKEHPDDPELLAALAEAFSPDDRPQMLELLETALEKNPNNIEGRLLLADHMIDAEQYDLASEELGKIEEVNPWRPEALAYRAVIAHLKEKPEEFKALREKALKFWSSNPLVDFTIGKKLSQKYRFAEGSAFQRQALLFDKEYLPSKIQLAQDLLRLGEDAEGWALAEQVHKADAYDVGAYNLVTLRDTISKFNVSTNEFFRVRMSAMEADIYGGEVLKLLEQARTILSAKYGMPIDKQVTVEIFPAQKDFAVRTFGMPGGEGYLGVCFGNVITANSPASRGGNEMNWKAMLWHEFCHVVTLRMTKNKMPRWLSEGISVYEERLRNPSWGEKLTPQYREMIAKGEMKPISELSSAFMAPPTPMHLQFAYYESSLAVQFIAETYGHDSLKQILRDIGDGKPIIVAFAARTTEMKKLEGEFEAYVKNIANEMGPDSRWAKPARNPQGEIDGNFIAANPDNFWVIKEKGEKLLEAKKWEEAAQICEKAIEMYPGQTGNSSAYAMLARCWRELNQPEKEREVLTRWLRIDSEGSEGLMRAMEIDRDRKDWKRLGNDAEQLMAINPLIIPPHRGLAESSAALEKPAKAAEEWKTVLKLEPPDPAEVHFMLASNLKSLDQADAKRHALQAIEEAPRFRAAHALLLELENSGSKPGESAK